jgi:O-antigen/teichoic acid export membrane protein
LADIEKTKLKEKLKLYLPEFLVNFLTKGAARSVKVKKNIVYSFIIRSFNILISFLLVPLTINYVNPTQYGIWLTLSSILGWFSFFDIGFGNGLRNKFAEAVALGKYKLARVYVSTTYALVLLIAIFLFLVLTAVNLFVDWNSILNSTDISATEIRSVSSILIFFFSLQLVLQLITVIQVANQEPAKAGLIKFGANFLVLCGTFALVHFTKGNLFRLSIITYCLPAILFVVCSVWLFKNRYRQYAPDFKLVQLRFGKPLILLGVKFFLIQIAFILLYQSSNIIITQMQGPAAVTEYNIVFKYFSAVPMILTIIITPFWSAFTDAWFKKDVSWISKIVQNLIRIWYGLLFIILLMVIFADEAYYFWIGDSVKPSSTLTYAIAIYTVVNTWNTIFSYLLNGIGKIKLQLILSLSGSVIHIPLAIFLSRRFGIEGVILSTAFVSLVNAILLPIQYRRLMKSSATGVWNQ